MYLPVTAYGFEKHQQQRKLLKILLGCYANANSRVGLFR